MNDCGLNSRKESAVVSTFASICLVIVALCGGLCAAEVPERLTIVVFGDSQAQGVAGGLQRNLIDDSRFKVLNRTHPGAAFVHDETEWIAPIRKFLSQEKADIAVVMFGANDRLDIRDGHSGTYLRFKSEAWRNEYSLSGSFAGLSGNLITTFQKL